MTSLIISLSSGSTRKSSSLAICTAFAVISSTCPEPLKVTHEGLDQCVPTLINVNILSSIHDPGMFFMALWTVSPFQKVFYLFCPDSSEKSLLMATIALFFFKFIFGFGGTGVLTQDLTLIRQALYYLIHIPNLFFLLLFFE
jgi:hypothetical protein